MAGSDIITFIYNNLDVFVLVFVRVVGFMVITPLFSGQTVPMMVKLGFGLCFSALVMLSGTVQAPTVTGDFLSYFLLIASEFAAGWIIGFIVYLMFAVFYFVGQMADYQIGFSMVSVYDPMSQTQAPITGNLYYFVMLTFFLVSGGINLLVYFLFDTYAMIPPGTAFIIGNGGLQMYIVHMLATYLELGFKFAMPVIAVIIIVDVALGVLVKATPQMNVFVVGMPLKVGIGMLTLFLVTPVMDTLIFEGFMNNLMQNVYNVIKGLAT